MKIKGLNKLTLLDFPGRMACVVFLPSCNFRCPFCHNASLVTAPSTQPDISEEEFFAFLEKRKGILEGVCITGGEPTLYPDLGAFIDRIKSLGFLVKLDTNGYNPDELTNLLSKVDYVAMDIKNSPSKYAETVGVKNFDFDKIKRSVEILESSGVEHEFRMTVAPELQEESDFYAVQEWLKGVKKFYLQAYRDSGDVINPIFSTPDEDFLEKAKRILEKGIEKVEIRG
ncbi:MAG: anaerobic ribonucleoside-triphosphate reductase activating protein [Clostridia bacterium]|nr:anaerobic ribonucleoside-triphosphate reductase activating protein [Clostridia bacterium]